MQLSETACDSFLLKCNVRVAVEWKLAEMNKDTPHMHTKFQTQNGENLYVVGVLHS